MDLSSGRGRCRPNHNCRHPRKRVIQYAAASRFYHRRLWDTGSPAFAGDDKRMCVRILATRCARGLGLSFAPIKSEGAGNAGCALHPRSHAQCAQKVRACAYRAAENIRHSLRNGFTAYNELSPVNGSFATVAPEELAPHELEDRKSVV